LFARFYTNILTSTAIFRRFSPKHTAGVEVKEEEKKCIKLPHALQFGFNENLSYGVIASIIICKGLGNIGGVFTGLSSYLNGLSLTESFPAYFADIDVHDTVIVEISTQAF